MSDQLPKTLVIFGASGDLTARKLIPSLYRLDRKKRLPEGVRIVGVSRTKLTHLEFQNRMGAAVKQFAGADWNQEDWDQFAPRLQYCPGDASTSEGLASLEEWFKANEGAGGARLFYLSVSPDLYGSIVSQLAGAGLTKAPSPELWRRIIIEKPFGRNTASAQLLNEEIRQFLKEDQIYRIDHYLGKETVQNLLVFRFGNTLFEPLWNANYIDHVQITVAETVKVGSRGDYYDRAGVLRDMFQNHLLQIMAIVAMEAPARYSADMLRNEKVKLLEAITVPDPKEASESIWTGQYEGYLAEKGVNPASKTPTYSAIRLNVDNWRWRGVPFFLRSGKALASRTSEVQIQFRCPPHLMFSLPPGEKLECNRLAISIQPNESIHLRFQSKVPDQEKMTIAPSEMEFQYGKSYSGVAIPEAYERLLQDALGGDASLFMRSDEIERSWAIIEPFLNVTESQDAPIPEEYPLGSMGPVGADGFMDKNLREWLPLYGNRTS